MLKHYMIEKTGSRAGRAAIRALATGLAAAAIATTPARAQHLHTNDRWKECAIELSPSLTQEAWRQFVGEVGLVAYFRPLASAKPLGRGRFEVSALQWRTRIDAADDAWNDTFSHPDSTHWLFEGDALPISGLLARAGLTEKIDAAVYVTKNFRSNYGFVGGQLQYSLVNDADRNLAAAARLSTVRLFGPEDATATVYGADFVMSRSYRLVSPYAGVSGYLSHGREHTTKVDLRSESVFGVQGTLGAVVHLRGLRLGAEYTVAKVPAYAFKIGYGT